jgi:16S rRNA (guanine966-N2)-methyltransferase
MRIIAGKFRSRQLKSLKGLALRPTSDMLRETLFNILGPGVAGSRFLDLFAGTGAVGIEAISRGAISSVFVENHPAAVRLIRDNLASLDIKSEARIIATAAAPALAKLQKDQAAARMVLATMEKDPAAAEKAPVALEKYPTAAFDFIFLDPPYGNEKDYEATLRSLEHSSLVAEFTIVIAEHQKSFELPVSLGQLERARILRQGDAALSFYRHFSGEK